MTSIFQNEIIATNVLNYLALKDSLSLSSVNKEMYKIKLNPAHNSIINTHYRNLVFKEIYFNDLDDEEKAKNKDEFLDDYKITNNNWKQIFIDLNHHYYHYDFIVKKNYAKDVFKRFKLHMYLPFVRKSNKILENKESSLHQYYFYDFDKNKRIYTYYDKFLDLENNGFKGQNSENFLFRKNLFFENEFLGINELIKNVQGNNDFAILLEKIINYDYESIDKQYYNNKTNNEVFDFIIWLNHSAILFSKFLYSFINIHCYESNNKNELIIEYTNAQNNFVNFSLSINECYNNINLIINYLYRFIKDKTKSYNEFSIYKMFFKIMKKELYDNIQKNLTEDFNKLVEQYCKELLNFVDNGRTLSFGSNAKTDCGDNFEEDEELDFVIDELPMENEEKKELTKIEIINSFMTCITDLSIDEKNALCINHSNLKMDDNYQIYETILIDVFVREINNCINNEKKPIENIYTVFKNILSLKDQDNIKENKGFNFINRTKQLLFVTICSCLKKNIFQIIENEFSEYFKNIITNNKQNTKENSNIIINENLKKLIDELDKEEKLKIDNIYNDLLNKMKNEFETKANIICKSNNNIFVNTKDAINNYFETKNENFALLKSVLCNYYLENKLYSFNNNRISSLLKNDININVTTSKFL